MYTLVTLNLTTYTYVTQTWNVYLGHFGHFFFDHIPVFRIRKIFTDADPRIRILTLRTRITAKKFS
jgi:hypothetical protein